MATRGPGFLAASVVALITMGSGAAFAQPGEPAIAALKQSSQYDSLRAAYLEAQHQVQPSDGAGFKAQIPENRLEAQFNRDGAVTANHPEGSLGLRLTGYGYGSRLQTPAPANAHAAGKRMEYRRGQLTEWYVSESRGLEQGFTLSERPRSHVGDDPLTFELAVSGGLKPVLAGDQIELLRKDNGRAVLVYTGLRSWDSTGRALPGRMAVKDGRIRLEVADRGAVYPVTVDPWIQQQKLTASDAVAGDVFGTSLSVSGDTAVFGAFLKNGNRGAAYVFTRTGNTWTQQQELTASDATNNFGITVSVGGDTVAVGTNGNAAYVFTRTGTLWTQQQKLSSSDNRFGYVVSVNGDTAIIGAFANQANSPGAAYVFTRSGTTWTQQQKLTASDAAAGDQFGRSISVNGDMAVIGAVYGHSSQGAAYVFTRSGTTWTQQQELTASDAATSDRFGHSVSFSGDTAVIGAHNKNSAQGAAYVFTRSGTTWTQQQKLTASDAATGDNFGIAVSISGDTTVIGAYAKNSAQGAAYVFTRSGTTWTQQQELTSSDTANNNDAFGIDVSISGDTAIICSYGKNASRGAAYVFNLPALPAISNLRAISVGGNSEVISWTTDQPSSSLVNFGATPTYGSSSTPDANLVTNHSVTLAGLASKATYNFDVVSTNATNGTTASTNSTFVTTPFVGFLAFWAVNNSGVSISWSTDVPANTVVAFGTSPALGQFFSPGPNTLSTNHGAVLTGLNSGTTYYFMAQSTDANGNIGGSTIYKFTTTGASSSPAPIITGVNVTGITMTSATINWTTDLASSSQVNYGLVSAYGLSSPLVARLLTSHSVTLTNLAPGTLWNFDAVSQNGTGTATGTSANYTFMTLASTATPPVISNVMATPNSPTSATITWTTDQPSWSQVNYGLTTAYGLSSTLDTSQVTSHSVNLTGLTASTAYNFDVMSTNAGALSATSPNGTFMTPAVSAAPPPSVGFVAFWGINNSGVTISWSTDVLANTQVAYGTSTALGQLSPLQTAMTNSHGVVLTGLNSGTTYNFVAQSTGANASTGYSSMYSFTTTGIASTAPVISNVTIGSITNTSAVVMWTTDQPSSSKVNYGLTTGYGSATPPDSTLVTNHSVTLNNLSPGTTYNLDVVSANSTAASTTSGNYSFLTTGTAVTGPVISSVTASGLTSSSVTINWTTDQPSSSLVNYGTSPSYGLSSALNTTLVTIHSVTLANLTPSTTYNFDVVSMNSSGMTRTSANAVFVTPAASAVPPDVGYVAFWGVTSSGVTVSWSTNVPATTQLAYGTTPSLGQVSPLQSALTASHGVVLTGLNPSTTYYFVARSADINGVPGASTTYSFTTGGW